MIPSRDLAEVEKWLKTFPNLQIFSRDGSITYRKAIDNAHEVHIQVSDRFHLYKNLTTYATDIWKKELPIKVAIPLPQPKVKKKEIKPIHQPSQRI